MIVVLRDDAGKRSSFLFVVLRGLQLASAPNASHHDTAVGRGPTAALHDLM